MEKIGEITFLNNEKLRKLYNIHHRCFQVTFSAILKSDTKTVSV